MLYTRKKNNQYPLCIGRNLEKCEDCQIRADWEPEDPYGVERLAGSVEGNMERDIEKDLLEIEYAIKCHIKRDNMFTVSVLQRCHKLVSQLKEYKDLEEQGKLLKLTCAVGTIVYEPYQFMGEGAWEIDVHKIRLEDLEKIGKTVFLTREDAEAALKELEGAGRHE